MKNNKTKITLLIVAVYTLTILALIFVSNAAESGKDCLSINPYWHYGPVILPCYFFDTVYKLLLYPSYIFAAVLFGLLMPPTGDVNTNVFLAVSLFANDLILYVLLSKLIYRKRNIVKAILLCLIIIIPAFAIFANLVWPSIVEAYCQGRAKKIVGNQWNKVFKAEGDEKKYASEIFWGFREQLKCEHRFGL